MYNAPSRSRIPEAVLDRCKNTRPLTSPMRIASAQDDMRPIGSRYVVTSVREVRTRTCLKNGAWCSILAERGTAAKDF